MWKIENKIEYFLKTWEWRGVGQEVASIDDGPDSFVDITVSNLREVVKRIKDLEDDLENAHNQLLEQGERDA